MTAALVLAAMLFRAAQEGPGATGKPPPPRQAIAGLPGFDSVSTVVFPETPDRNHRLRATYAFPDRVRWQWTRIGEDRGDHEVRYRYGDGFYLLREGAQRSEECAGVEREEMRLAMELRRALVLYPDGFDWKEAGGERKADLGEAGALFARATSASDARPAEMRASTRDGRTVEVCQGITWREKGGRTWPSGLEVWRLGKLAWRETIDSIDVEGKVIDAFFLPVDRRAVDRRPGSGTTMPVEEARDQELPASCGLRVEAPKGTDWNGIAIGYDRLREEWTARLEGRGLAVDRHATVEIDAKGDPVAWIVRLDPIPESPPPDFRSVPARRGIALAVSGFGSIRPEKLGVLARALPPGSTAGNAYVRFVPEVSKDALPSKILIVLPYSPPRKG